jgi:alkyl hydroperoxide reductase subunit F
VVSHNIVSDLLEISEFPHVARKYDVEGVPRVVINETHHFEGALPLEMYFLEVLKAVDPEEYARMEQIMEEDEEQGKTRQADPSHIYDMMIVGGGPAAFSAAIYAARKALDVLLITKSFGGQIYYTASVENYLGFPRIDGREMIERFLTHARQYPIAMHGGESVSSIGGDDDEFTAHTEKGTVFRGKSVIYCAGKEYRRLGVPGEDRYIGRGIAFCATCDAPLFRGKTVAIVGGGNSALTAVRDLLPYAGRIYLINRSEKFSGDAPLLDRIRNEKNVTVYTGWVVKRFQGDERLNGIRLLKTASNERMDLKVVGVFLEIGLSPNTAPVKDLVKLNRKGEIPVRTDNSTSLRGFFAAGDVTDIPEKQICVAAGEGGKAAITASRYLLDRGLARGTDDPDLKDTWME